MPIHGPGGAPSVSPSEFEEFKEQTNERLDRLDGNQGKIIGLLYDLKEYLDRMDKRLDQIEAKLS